MLAHSKRFLGYNLGLMDSRLMLHTPADILTKILNLKQFTSWLNKGLKEQIYLLELAERVCSISYNNIYTGIYIYIQYICKIHQKCIL